MFLFGVESPDVFVWRRESRMFLFGVESPDVFVWRRES